MNRSPDAKRLQHEVLTPEPFSVRTRSVLLFDTRKPERLQLLTMTETKNDTPLLIAILAGGKSSRMGSDKAGLTRDGETLLARTARLARTVSDLPPLIVGRNEPDDWGDVPARFVPDDSPDLGPVGGLRTALRLAGDRAVFALSCDLPALTDAALAWLIARERGELGVVTRNGEQFEPLFALYRAACLPLIEANIRAGRRSLHALIHASGGDGFAVADVPSEIAPALENVNTPEQWAAFLAR